MLLRKLQESVVSQELWTKEQMKNRCNITTHITCCWASDCFLPVLCICSRQGSVKCSYSTFSYVGESSFIEMQGQCFRAACFVRFTGNVTCCMLVYLWKWGKIGSYTHRTSVLFSPIVGTDGGNFFIRLFLFFSKMNSVLFFKKNKKLKCIKPKVATNRLLNCHWH